MREEIAGLISIISADADTVVAELTVPPDFSGFQGHFDSSSILPGVCIIDAVLRAGEESTGSALKIAEIRSAKFFAPVRPEMSVRMKVNVERSGDGSLLRAVLDAEGRTIAKIVMLARLK